MSTKKKLHTYFIKKSYLYKLKQIYRYSGSSFESGKLDQSLTGLPELFGYAAVLGVRF